MTPFILGNLLGRLALCYAIVWLVTWLMLARLDWRNAFRRTNHWSGLVAIVTTFFIGLIATQSHGVAP
ncbi:MAG: hypothetical protein SXG53_01275 [Pseudomonadota bacterium]|nr:hypothetical protein [Pseudomonadota bacterium]